MNLGRLSPFYLSQVIRDEIHQGALYEELLFPQGALRHFKVIQFSRTSADGETYAGLGCSTSQKKASLQATFEFLERKAFREKGVQLGFTSTNGVALHKFRNLAVRAAKSELLERDALLIHWYARLPFVRLTHRHTASLRPQMEQLKTLGFETLIVETTHGFQPTVVTFIIDRVSLGFTVGTSSGRTKHNNVTKSFLEACISLFFGHCGQSKEDLLQCLQVTGIRGLKEHRAFWLHEESLPTWILDKPLCPSNQIKLHRPFEVIEFTKNPFFAVGVRHSEVLPLRLGMPTVDDLKIVNKRLSDKRTLPFALQDLLPHPIT